jgi:hypothetical protein
MDSLNKVIRRLLVEGCFHEPEKHEVYQRIREGRFDKDGSPKPTHKRAFEVGQKLADREWRDPKTRPENKKKAARVEKVKGGGSVRAGKRSRMNQHRGETSY